MKHCWWYSCQLMWEHILEIAFCKDMSTFSESGYMQSVEMLTRPSRWSSGLKWSVNVSLFLVLARQWNHYRFWKDLYGQSISSHWKYRIWHPSHDPETKIGQVIAINVTTTAILNFGHKKNSSRVQTLHLTNSSSIGSDLVETTKNTIYCKISATGLLIKS